MRSLKLTCICSSVLWCLASPPSSQASPLSEAAASLQPGEWTTLSTIGYGQSLLFACNGINNVLEWSNKGVWDAVNREVHFVGQGHTACAKHLVYSEADNTWRTEALPAGIEEFGHGYEHNAINPQNGDFYYRNYNSDQVEVFNSSTRRWSLLPRIRTSLQVAGAIAYSPDAGGLLFVDGDFGVWFYRQSSNSWRTVATPAMGSIHNFASYNPAHKLIYFGGGDDSRRVYTFDADRNVTRIADAPVPIAIDSAMSVADPATGIQLLFADNGRIYAYDRTNDSWPNIGTHPVMDNALDWRVVIPISSYSVIMFLTWNFNNSAVLLYRHQNASTPPPEPRRPSPPEDLAASQ